MRRRTLISLAVLVVLAIPAVSIAGDRFTDVPSTNTFHNDITWLADQGVTKGCNPPANSEFCPNDVVTRETMAAFMRRFAGTLEAGAKPLLVGSEGPNTILAEDSWKTLDSMTINVPAGGGALLLNGTAAFFVNDLAFDLGALGILEVTLDEACSAGAQGIAAMYNTVSAGGDTATAVGSLPVSKGSHTVRLCGWALHLDTSEFTDVLVPRVSALWAADGQIETLALSSSKGSGAELASQLRERIGALRR